MNCDRNDGMTSSVGNSFFTGCHPLKLKYISFSETQTHAHTPLLPSNALKKSKFAHIYIIIDLEDFPNLKKREKFTKNRAAKESKHNQFERAEKGKKKVLFVFQIKSIVHLYGQIYMEYITLERKVLIVVTDWGLNSCLPDGLKKR